MVFVRGPIPGKSGRRRLTPGGRIPALLTVTGAPGTSQNMIYNMVNRVSNKIELVDHLLHGGCAGDGWGPGRLATLSPTLEVCSSTGSPSEAGREGRYAAGGEEDQDAVLQQVHVGVSHGNRGRAQMLRV